MCCQSSASHPSAGLKNYVPTRRSNARQELAMITAGMANSTMNEVTKLAHTKMGSRSKDIPGAFCLKVVTITFTATDSAESSVNVISCAQTSTRLPGECAGPE